MLTLTILNVILNIIKVHCSQTRLRSSRNGLQNKGGMSMAIEVMPDWMATLEDEDVVFIKRFLQASGSLKEIAHQYEVTYPTVRLRLDKLIQKIQISEDLSNEPYVALIKRLAINDKIDFDTAKILISEYKKMGGKE